MCTWDLISALIEAFLWDVGEPLFDQPKAYSSSESIKHGDIITGVHGKWNVSLFLYMSCYSSLCHYPIKEKTNYTNSTDHNWQWSCTVICNSVHSQCHYLNKRANKKCVRWLFLVFSVYTHYVIYAGAAGQAKLVYTERFPAKTENKYRRNCKHQDWICYGNVNMNTILIFLNMNKMNWFEINCYHIRMIVNSKYYYTAIFKALWKSIVNAHLNCYLLTQQSQVTSYKCTTRVLSVLGLLLL